MNGVPIFPSGIVKQYISPIPFGDNTDSEFLNFYGSSLTNLDVTTNHKNNIWRNWPDIAKIN